MILTSKRHTADDLALWREHYAADRVCGVEPSKLAKSLAAIERFVASGPAYISVSWGKDSVVAAHLVHRVNRNIPIINFRCTNRNPDCDRVRDAFIHRALYPVDYEEVEVDYSDLHGRNLPAHELNKLTDERWHKAIRQVGSRFDGRHVLGIRADESHGRRVRCYLWGHNSPNGCAPLAWWTAADVFAYLATWDLPIHPAYAMLGGGRWEREWIRVAEIGDTKGRGNGRDEWEKSYYGDILNMVQSGWRPIH